MARNDLYGDHRILPAFRAMIGNLPNLPLMGATFFLDLYEVLHDELTWGRKGETSQLLSIQIDVPTRKVNLSIEATATTILDLADNLGDEFFDVKEDVIAEYRNKKGSGERGMAQLLMKVVIELTWKEKTGKLSIHNDVRHQFNVFRMGIHSSRWN